MVLVSTLGRTKNAQRYGWQNSSRKNVVIFALSKQRKPITSKKETDSQKNKCPKNWGHR
jgi:hypothetical protein